MSRRQRDRIFVDRDCLQGARLHGPAPFRGNRFDDTPYIGIATQLGLKLPLFPPAEPESGGSAPLCQGGIAVFLPVLGAVKVAFQIEVIVDQ